LRQTPVDPVEDARSRTSQHRDVQRQQQQADWQHPKPKHRQKAEKTAANEQDSGRYPHPPRLRLAQPAKPRGNSIWQPVLQIIEMSVEMLVFFVGHASKKSAACCSTRFMWYATERSREHHSATITNQDREATLILRPVFSMATFAAHKQLFQFESKSRNVAPLFKPQDIN
jgi:hypothetical protein